MMTDREAPSPMQAQNLWMLECWRGVAALMVVWTHWAPVLGWGGGLGRFAFTGVDVFFVLSGFVFAPALLGAQPLRHAGAFALRRVARIYPAYVLSLALYVGLAWRAGKPLLYVPEHLLMAHVQSREMAFYYNPPFWSLPSEVEFYALVGLCACLPGAARRGFGWPWLFGLAVFLRLLLVANADGASQNWAYLMLHHLPGLLVEFLLGAWAWQVYARGLGRVQRWCWGVGGLLGALATAWLYGVLEDLPGRSGWFNGQLGLVLAACFACVLAATAQWRPRHAGLAACGQWAGRLSYGVYLLHPAWQGMLGGMAAAQGRWLALALSLGALLVSALVLHLAVEEPARRWGRRVAGRWEAAPL